MKLKGMTTAAAAAATSGAQPEKAKEPAEAEQKALKNGAGASAEGDGVQPTATWLQVHMQFMFLSLLFFYPGIRMSAHPSPCSVSPFVMGKSFSSPYTWLFRWTIEL